MESGSENKHRNFEKDGACKLGLDKFKEAHGDNEIMFSECVNSGSNSISDYFWFIHKQKFNNDKNLDLRLLAIEFAERALPIFESKYPQDSRPRKAVDAAKLYLSGDATLHYVRESMKSAHAAADDDDDDNTAACAAHAAAHAADYDVSDAFAAAEVAYAVDAFSYHDDDGLWQKQRLCELMVKWGW